LCQNCCGVGITFNCTDGIPSKQFASEYAATNACEKSQLIHTTSKIYGYAKREKISNKPLEADRFAAVQLKPLGGSLFLAAPRAITVRYLDRFKFLLAFQLHIKCRCASGPSVIKREHQARTGHAGYRLAKLPLALLFHLCLYPRHAFTHVFLLGNSADQPGAQAGLLTQPLSYALA
jgi:hypothetical protein